jgi:hypothetical protein
MTMPLPVPGLCSMCNLPLASHTCAIPSGDTTAGDVVVGVLDTADIATDVLCEPGLGEGALELLGDAAGVVGDAIGAIGSALGDLLG